MNKLGQKGIDLLLSILNDFFDKIIGEQSIALLPRILISSVIIQKHGGDIIKFAGDALLAIWTPSAREYSEVDAARCVLLATQCAYQMQVPLLHHISTSPHPPFYPISLVPDDFPGNLERLRRTGMRVDPAQWRRQRYTYFFSLIFTIGTISALHVGGNHGRFEFLVTGDPLEQVSECEKRAQPGQVYISHESWSYVNTNIGHSVLSVGVTKSDHKSKRIRKKVLAIHFIPLSIILSLSSVFSFK